MILIFIVDDRRGNPIHVSSSCPTIILDRFISGVVWIDVGRGVTSTTFLLSQIAFVFGIQLTSIITF